MLPINYWNRAGLLCIGHDAKTVKGAKLGYLTGILYLAPSTLSGKNVCPMATIAGCATACLNTAGRGRFTKVQAARLAKTQWFHTDRDAFMSCLHASVARLARKALKQSLIPLVRLNGTSDIQWETIAYTHADVAYANIFAAFPSIQFYDYTKIPTRDTAIHNYDLTYSYSGVIAYQRYVAQAMARDMRLAVVFRNKASIPSRFMGKEVLPGDDSDVRHLDPQGSIIALYAKGAAKTDYSGFVIDKPIFQLIAA